MQNEDADRRARLASLLEGMDAPALAHFESLLAPPASEGSPRLSQEVTRRQLMLGGASLVAGSLGGGVLGAAWGDAEGANRTQLRADEEIRRLKGLISLYEELERIGVDAVVSAAVALADKGLGTLRDGVLLLRNAVTLVDGAVANVESALPALLAALKTAESLVDAAKGQLALVQSAVQAATGRLQPVSDAVGSLLADLVSRIPFGVGDRILEANRRTGELVGGLPDALDTIARQLLSPLSVDWLSEAEGQGLNGRLITPLRRDLLKPLGGFLDDVAAFLAGLENALIKPGKTAIADRQKVRQKIAQYKAALATV